MTEDEANAIMANYGRYHGDADAATPSTIAAVIKAEAQHLTEKQHAALAAAVSQAGAGDGWSTGMLRRQYDIATAANPGLVVKVPTANELFVSLGWDQLQGQQRIEKWRSIEHLSEDERLAMLPETKAAPVDEKKVEPEKAAAPVELTDDQADDLIAERLGFPTRFAMRAATLAAKLRAYREAVRKDAAKPVAVAPRRAPASAGIDVNSETFKSLSPQQRMTRFRAAAGAK